MRILYTLLFAAAVAGCARGNSEGQSMTQMADSGVTSSRRPM